MVIAVLDLALTRSKHADRVAEILARSLATQGAVDVVTATHGVGLGEQRRIAVAAGWSGLTGDAAEQAVDAAAAAAGDLLEPGSEGGDGSCWWDGGFRGPPPWRDALAGVAADQAAQRGGRAVCFPGSGELRGVVSVAHIRQVSAVDEVRVLAGGVAEGAALVETRDFVRPRYADGRLVLDTQLAAGGRLICFEIPNPTPCCADHG